MRQEQLPEKLQHGIWAPCDLIYNLAQYINLLCDNDNTRKKIVIPFNAEVLLTRDTFLLTRDTSLPLMEYAIELLQDKNNALEQVMLPINLYDTHWVSINITKINNNIYFDYFDTLGNEFDSKVKKNIEKIKIQNPSLPIHTWSNTIPIQLDNSSCGPLTMEIIKKKFITKQILIREQNIPLLEEIKENYTIPNESNKPNKPNKPCLESLIASLNANIFDKKGEKIDFNIDFNITSLLKTINNRAGNITTESIDQPQNTSLQNTHSDVTISIKSSESIEQPKHTYYTSQSSEISMEQPQHILLTDNQNAHSDKFATSICINKISSKNVLHCIFGTSFITGTITLLLSCHIVIVSFFLVAAIIGETATLACDNTPKVEPHQDSERLI